MRAIVDRRTIEAGLKWVYMSRERATDQGDARTLRRSFAFAPTTKEKLEKLLRLLADEPAVTVLEVEWAPADPASDPSAVGKVHLEVGRRVRKPR